MWAWIRQGLAESVRMLLPPACLLCGRLLPANHDKLSFCHPCFSSIDPLNTAHCRCCAQPFPDATSNHLCSNCLKRPPSFSCVHTAGAYQGSLKDAVQKLKYQNQLTLASPLGQLLCKAIVLSENGFKPDHLIPVPLHPSRLRQRGYNQALELARPVAEQLGVTINTSLLQRIRKTPQQQGLSATERKSNLRGAFTLTEEVNASRVLLIDDVMTTGETARECSRTLLSGGITEVQVATIGRA